MTGEKTDDLFDVPLSDSSPRVFFSPPHYFAVASFLL
jgi:hypothetical protein